MKRAVGRYKWDFLAIIGLVLIAAVVATVILSHQRVNLPGWVPVLGKDFRTLKAEFETAQSVMPGQGQTVAIAGVEVGDITSVELKNGRAVVAMKIRSQYGPVYNDADLLLRPKTGLNDMFIQLYPGHKSAGAVPEGGTLPVQNSLPNVNLDEIVAMLDADTRDYLELLLGGAGGGLKNRGRDLAQTFRRFEPTSRDAARLFDSMATRRKLIKRMIHNFRLVSEELNADDQRVARWVDSTDALLAAFAEQDQNLRQTIKGAPGAFREMAGALRESEKLAAEAGPALRDLEPLSRKFGPALKKVTPLLKQSTPLIRDQLRPLSRESRPLLADLRPAARDIDKLSPDLVQTADVLNKVLNTFSYNPAGKEEGYLFWLAWLNHSGNSIFSVQDAHAPVRRGRILINCGQLDLAERVATGMESLKLVLSLIDLPKFATNCK